MLILHKYGIAGVVINAGFLFKYVNINVFVNSKLVV